MPFIQVFDFDDQRGARRGFVGEATEAIASRLQVDMSSITFYFSNLAAQDYGQSGYHAERVPYRRLFVHFHSYARPDDSKREIASALTRIIAQRYATPAEHVAIYFFDRLKNEVAHGGTLACDV